MPKLLELLFYVAGLFLVFVDAFRQMAFRREWKRQAGDDRRQRFKMSSRQRIESSLYMLGWMICWTVGFPAWWMRASSAVLAVAVIAGLLYRNNLKAPDTPPYDAASMLHLKNAQGEG